MAVTVQKIGRRTGHWTAPGMLSILRGYPDTAKSGSTDDKDKRKRTTDARWIVGDLLSDHTGGCPGGDHRSIRRPIDRNRPASHFRLGMDHRRTDPDRRSRQPFRGRDGAAHPGRAGRLGAAVAGTAYDRPGRFCTDGLGTSGDGIDPLAPRRHTPREPAGDPGIRRRGHRSARRSWSNWARTPATSRYRGSTR